MAVYIDRTKGFILLLILFEGASSLKYLEGCKKLCEKFQGTGGSVQCRYMPDEAAGAECDGLCETCRDCRKSEGYYDCSEIARIEGCAEFCATPKYRETDPNGRYVYCPKLSSSDNDECQKAVCGICGDCRASWGYDCWEVEEPSIAACEELCEKYTGKGNDGRRSRDVDCTEFQNQKDQSEYYACMGLCKRCGDCDMNYRKFDCNRLIMTTTPTPTPAPTPNSASVNRTAIDERKGNGKKDGLSTGIIVAIVVGGILLCVAGGIAVYCCCKRKEGPEGNQVASYPPPIQPQGGASSSAAASATTASSVDNATPQP